MKQLILATLLFGFAPFSSADEIALVFATNRTTTIAIDWEHPGEHYQQRYVLTHTQLVLGVQDTFQTAFKKFAKRGGRQYLIIQFAFNQYDSACFEVRKSYVEPTFSKCVTFNFVTEQTQ